jgi:hypothetical protein
MTQDGITVAVFDTHDQAERAVRAVNNGGIDLRKISIIGKGVQREEHALGFYTLGDRVRFFGGFGAFWGTLAGILLGAFVMFIPVFGHLIILGPLAATVVSAIEGAAVGGAAGALVGALVSIGVPKNSAIKYETALRANKFLVTVQGSRGDMDLARDVLRPMQPAELETHELKDVQPA